jgi:hypothetical protein
MHLSTKPWVNSAIRFGATFIVVVMGVLVGAALTTRLGIIKTAEADSSGALAIPPVLTVGEVFPDIEATEAGGTAVRVRDLLMKQPRSVIGFFSAGCGSCQTYLAALAQSSEVQNGTLPVYVLTPDPIGVENGGGKFVLLRIGMELAGSLGVHVWPTSLLVDQSAVITGAYVGFRPSAPPDFLAKKS